MKKVLICFVCFMLCAGMLMARTKARVETPLQEISPVRNAHTSPSQPVDDLYDLQFQWPVGVGGGEAGVETDGNYLYTTKWNGTVFYQYQMDGTYVGEFACGAAASIRDLAWDGTYFYGGAATSTVYEMDFTNQTVISTFNAPTDVRAIAYDPVNDGFWANNWSSDITLFDRNGNTLNSFVVGAMGSFYGFAWEDVLPGGPFLWGYSQDGTGNELIKMDIAAGGTQVEQYDIAQSGITYAAGEIAGGLCISDQFVAGKWSLCGTVQNVSLWGLELGDAAPPTSPAMPLDFVLTPDPGGALSASCTWTCPSLQVNGDPLTELMEMRLYRNDVLIYTDSAPTIGGTGSYTDAAVPASGTYMYKLYGYNSAGEGIPATASSWIGEDVPGPVTDLVLMQTAPGALSATLTWTNPTTGLNGGAFNNPIVGYHITRSDGTVLEMAGMGTTYVDNTVPVSGNWFYSVQPYNTIGDGGETTSNTVLIADPGMLVFEEFEVVPPPGWYVDGLGQGNWSAQGTNNAGGTAPEMQLSWSPSFVGVSRMCTPQLNTVGMTELTLEFKHAVNDYVGGYTLGVATTSDGVTWNEAWSIVPAGAVGPTTETITITTPDVGSATLQMCFFLDGDSFNINYWYIDDCILSGPPVALGAPGAPTGVTIVPDPGGALQTDIDWTCPTTNVVGDPLTELLEMRVYRDGTLVYTDSNPTIGGAGSYTDVVPDAGFHDYMVVGYNTEGEGVPVGENLWCGEDVPAGVDDLELQELNGNGYLTWINPTQGLHGGPYNLPILGYHITRSDNVVFEIAGSATEYTDTTIPGAAYYSYEVVPYNASGDGGSAMSNTMMLGAGSVLFFDDFENSFANWDVINNGGIGMWMIYADPFPNGYTLPPESTGNIACADSDEAGSGSTTDTTIELLTPLDLTLYDTVNLQFDSDFYAIDADDYCYVDVSADGGNTWDNVLTYAGVSVRETHEIIDITSQVAFQGNVLIRFHSVQPGWDWWWAIDNVGVYGTMGGTPGYISGTVTLDGGTGSVTDVTVQAGNTSTSPDANGDYMITIAPGTYNVTASLDGYVPETIEDVVVTEGNTTSGIDFMLAPVPPPMYPPANVAVDDQTGLVTWDEPGAGGGVLYYHGGYDANGIGTGGAAEFTCAARFTADELTDFYGMPLTGIRMVIHSGDFSMVEAKVWEGGSYGDPGTEVYSADITGSISVADWTDHVLSTPVMLTAGNEYWVGYHIMATGDHPAAVDAGPMVPDKGAWMLYNGNWNLLPELGATLDFNWCIEGVVGSGAAMLNPLPNVPASMAKNKAQVPSLSTAQMKAERTPRHKNTTPVNNTRELLGYNVYLDGNPVANTITEMQYQLEDLVYGTQYTAGVSAVYDTGESDIVNVIFTYYGDHAGTPAIPLVTELTGNYPNPFNPSTDVRFSISEPQHVQVTIYNIKGEKVCTLLDDELQANYYSIPWNSRDDSGKAVASGIYFYRMRAGKYTSTKKMILMK
jgi:hypothetical protein